MKSWIKKNLRNIIVTSFVIPILLVAFVSISHVTSFYGISNPLSWAIYLSVAIEIAAISALAGLSVRMGKFIYIPFGIVTLIQFIGNIFFSFSYIDETSVLFKDWVEMTGGLLEPLGIEPTDISSHKRILALFSGGMLPLISLTFAHMLVKFSNTFDEEKSIKTDEIDLDVLSKEVGKIEALKEEERWKPTEKEIETLDSILKEKIQNIEEEQKYTPTEKEVESFEKILNEIQLKKFQNLVETTTLPVEELTTEVITETTTIEPEVTTMEQIETTTTTLRNRDFGDHVKRLNYLSRNSNV